eukprot:365250-Chlamydomonas_euryale.AAC.3
MAHVLRMDEDPLPGQDLPCSVARSVAEDCRVEQFKLKEGHRNTKEFLECTVLQSRSAMRRASVVAPRFGIF